MQHILHIIGAESSYFHFKASLKYFRASEGRSNATSCPFIPQLPLTEPPDQPSNLPKMAPGSVMFVLCDGFSVVPWVLKLSIIIGWIYLKLVGLMMLSLSLHPTLSRKNMTQTTLEIAFSDELQAVNIC